MQIDPSLQQQRQPRAIGSVRLNLGRAGRIETLYQQGSAKLLFPRSAYGTDGIFINTSGGLTGGDRLSTQISCSSDAVFTLSTQGFERIYKSRDSTPAKVRNAIHVSDQARCYWLPQETLFYDQGSLDRRLDVTLEQEARALIVEPIIFGRLAMSETQIRGHLQDHMSLTIDGEHVFIDNTLLNGDITATLERPAVAAGARAMALIIYRAPDAEAVLHRLRHHLNETSGASLLCRDLCIARILAMDGLRLRKILLPILDSLTPNGLPKTWRL